MSNIRNKQDERILIIVERVLHSLKRVRADKPTGPDSVPVRVFMCYAEQLAPVIRILFQDSIDQGIVSTNGKSRNIKSIAKVKFPKVFNYFRPLV